MGCHCNQDQQYTFIAWLDGQVCAAAPWKRVRRLASTHSIDGVYAVGRTVRTDVSGKAAGLGIARRYVIS
jgi:hypothetical protein